MKNNDYLPIPIIHVDYEINQRVLAASRSLDNISGTTSTLRRDEWRQLDDILLKNISKTRKEEK